MLKQVDGVIVPGGFGDRGFEGKILAAKYCRENKVPFLGICLGMHAVVVEQARNVLGLEGAHSEEFDARAPTKVSWNNQNGLTAPNNTPIFNVLQKNNIRTGNCVYARILHERNGWNHASWKPHHDLVSSPRWPTQLISG